MLYTKENYPEIIKQICDRIRSLTINENVALLAKETRVKISTFRNVISSRSDSRRSVSIECLGDILFKLRGRQFNILSEDGVPTPAYAPQLNCRIDGESIYLPGTGVSVLHSVLQKKITPLLKRHSSLSYPDLFQVLGISYLEHKKMTQGESNTIRTRRIFEILDNLGVQITIELTDTPNYPTIIPVTKDITQLINPTSASVSAIAEVSRQYVRHRNLTPRLLSRDHSLPEDDVKEFLDPSSTRRFPLLFAVAVANACGATVSISVI